MIRTLRRPARLIAALASALLLTTPAMSAGAAGTTLGHTATPSTVVDGGTVNLTVTSPLYGAGTATRWLQEKIDPSRVHLTSPSQIKAPEGWKVQYSTDGVSYTDIPPSTPEGWGLVQYVRARGSLTSGGIVNGKQAVTTTKTVQAPSSITNFEMKSGGDGWDAAFAPWGQVFNWNHHGIYDDEASLECHQIGSGAYCPTPTAWDWRTSASTPNKADIWFNPATNKIWGFGEGKWPEQTIFAHCVAVTPTSMSVTNECGRVRLLSSAPGDFLSREVGFAEVGGKIFTMTAQGQLVCFDTNAANGVGAPCPGQPYLSAGPVRNRSSLVRIGSEIVGVNGTGAFCFDPKTSAPCSWWSTVTPLAWHIEFPSWERSNNTPVFGWQQPDASGAIDIACFMVPGNNTGVTLPNQTHCFRKTGQEVTLTSASTFAGLVDEGTYGNLMYLNSPQVIGTKLFMALSAWGKVVYAKQPSTILCFDMATSSRCSQPWVGPGPLAANDGSGSAWSYTVKQNPYQPDCLYVVSDSRAITEISATTGTIGCPKTQESTFTFTGLNSRLGCTSGASSWSSFALSTPAIETGGAVKSASISVLNSSGARIPGWQNVQVPNNGIVGLSQLPTSLTGENPTFEVNLIGGATSATASLTSLGNSPQLCISPTVSYVCPGGYDAVSTLPNSIAVILATDDTAVAPGVGVDITVRQPQLLACTGIVAGTVLDTSGNPVPGLPVSITDRVGFPIGFNGGLYTTTTKADGTYSFPGLRPNLAYAVRFPDTAVATAVSATVPSGDGAGTTTASGGSVASNAAGVLAGATTIINALYTQLIDLTPDAEVVPKNTTTTLHPLANDEPATGNTLVTSSVKLCGPSEAPPACTQSSVTVTEGTFVVNPNGSVNFTPTTDFTGVVTPVTYQASDTGPTTGSAVINVTVVGAPTAQPVTSIDDVNVTQTLTPLSGATVDPAAGWASTPLLLCGALESTGSCTQSSVSVDGVGVYTVTQDNEVSFVPAHNYVGSPAPISFDVVDGIGQRASSTISVTVRPTIPEVPSSPSVTAGTTSATVSFDVPAWDGGSPVLSYLVEDGVGKHSCTVTVSGPGPYSCTVTGLNPGKIYAFVITATNAVGTGPEAVVAIRVGVLACTPGTFVEQRLGLLQSTTDFSSWTTLGQENGFVNAIAYRPADGFLYGIGTAARDLTGPENHLMRIAGDGSVTDLGVVEGLPATRSEAKFPAGAFDPYSGHLVVGGRGHLYSIDVDTHRATQIPLPDGVSRIGWDLVIQGEWLWTVTSTQVVGINLSSDESVSYDLPAGYVSHGYGSVWSGSDDSSIFFQSNATGDITRVTGLGSTPSFSKVGNLPSAPRNDGASCPGALT